MILFPTDGIWKSSTSGDKFGHVVRTKNISFEKNGYLSLAKKALTLYSNDDDSGFGNPLVILPDNQYVYVLTDAPGFFVINTEGDVLSILQTSGTNAPSFDTWSDAVIFNGKVNASGDTNVSAIAFGQGQTWPVSKKITSLDEDTPHPLCVIEHLNLLAVGNGNEVAAYDTDYSVQDTLTLPAEYMVVSMRWRNNFLYIATRHLYGGDAKLFIWNGTGSTAQAGYTTQGADWIYSLADYQSSIALVVSTGQILRFNGGGFDEIASFPIYYTPYSWSSTADASSLVGKVASRGMQTSGDRLYINIDGTATDGTFLPEQPSGLWILDAAHGLHHHASPNYLSMQQLTPTELASSRLVFATSHQAETGDPVLCASHDTLVGPTGGQVYYAIVESATALQLALSAADALNGRSIDITGTPGTSKFTFDRYESFGETVFDQPGGICLLSRARFNPFLGSHVLFGASSLDASLSMNGVLMSVGIARNRGYFITPKISAANALSTLQKLVAYCRSLRLDTDQIVVKYRTSEKFGLPTHLAFSGSSSWNTSTSFTIDPTGKDVGSIEEGDEIEIVKGAGAGYLAHITNIDDTQTPYTYTIDEEMPVSTGAFDFIADNWSKLGTFGSDDEDIERGVAEQALEDVPLAHWIQFKIELRGRDIDLDAIAIETALT